MLKTQPSIVELDPAEPPIERRASPRRPVRMSVTVYVGDESESAHSLDLSVGGVRLETPHRLTAGTRPTLVLPLADDGPVMAVAEVLETTENGEGWVCRLAFRSLRPLDVHRLTAFVASPRPEDAHPRPGAG
jgi:hypothetical protein